MIMKKILLISALLLLNGIAGAITVKTVGSGGDYATLKLAFDAINSGSVTGVIQLNIMSDITDNNSAVLYASGTGSSSYTSVVIMPTGSPASGHRTLTAAINAAIIDLDGARNVTIDGRLGGTGSEQNLYLVNNAATFMGVGILLRENAIYNTVKYCHIACNNTTSTGAIHFGTGLSSSQGNSHNVIDHCDITHTASGVLNEGIASENSWNHRNTIKNCSIYDWLSEGIKLNPNCGDGWIIGGSGEGNSFYQTVSFSSPDEHYAIKATGGDSLAITGNFIGGGSTGCGAPVWTNTNTTSQSFGIYVSGSSAQTCYINSNMIRKISLSGTGFTCIEAYGGKSAIGTDGANYIGGGESLNDIIMLGSGPLTGIHAWGDAGAPDIHISSNQVQSLKINNTSNSSVLTGISISSTLTGNTIELSGNTVQKLNSNGSADGPAIIGIGISASSAIINVSENVIAQFTGSNGGSHYTWVEGINLDADNSTFTVSKNQVTDFSINSLGSGTLPEMDGIRIVYKNGTITASNNMIALSNGTNNNNIHIYGIRDRGISGTGSGDHKYFFNSIYIGGTSSGTGITSCFMRENDFPVTLVNNIFFNNRVSSVTQNLAVVVNSNSNTYLSSNHNDLYAKNTSTVGSVNGGSSQLTLSGWQGAFSPIMDAASLSVNPNFDSETNLRITSNALLDNTGVGFTGITDDIDGNSRSLTPDPGINEFAYTSYTVGTAGHFHSLKHAFDRINDGTVTGYIHLSIISNITNDTLATLNASGTGASSYSFILIQPGGSLTSPSRWTYQSGNLTGPMIILNGAGNVTIDGRIPGETSGINLLMRTFDYDNDKGEVIRFQNGANTNTIRNCAIQANNGAYNGAIHFGSSGSSPTGNSNNTIDNCEISYVTTQLKNAICTDSLEHKSIQNSIINCRIYNWSEHGVFISRPTIPGQGWIDYGNDNWMVSGNSFYRTAVGIPDGGTAIELQKGNWHNITNNFIGGAETGALGSSSGISGGIKVMGTSSTSVSQPDNIDGNIIRRISTGTFRGISVLDQNVNIGLYSGNKIGDSLLVETITCSGTASYGIYVLNHLDHVINICNNMIANITVSAFGTGDDLVGIGTIRNGSASYLGCNGQIFNNRIFLLKDISPEYIYHGIYYPAQPGVFGIQVKGRNLVVKDNKIYKFGCLVPYYEGVVDTVTGIWSDTHSAGGADSCTFYNNEVSLGYITSDCLHETFCGFYDASQAGVKNKYYFNSVYIDDGGTGNLTSTYCFLRKGGAVMNIFNNIFVNKRLWGGTPSAAGNFAIGLCSVSNFISNHNDLYAADPNRIGTVQCGTTHLNLKNWQFSFSPRQDELSVSVNPDFISVNDLHCTGPEALDDLGVCIPGISDDIDGNARLNPPDVGVNDFLAKTYKTWLGITNPNWDDATNWSPGGVPAATNNVRLNPGINFSPVIRNDGATCKDLLIQPGTILTINPGKTFDVKGVTILVKYCP